MDPVTASLNAAEMARRTGDPRHGGISQVPYLPGLDGLRAVAVVAVMVYHANTGWLAGGYVGVEVFFVISGYLITLLLIAEHERTGEIDLRGFWIRRFRRLLPALFLMMTLLSVWVALFDRDALGKLRGDVLAGAGYISNWYQIWIGAGYSAGSDFAPLRHLWSLAVEEQFYVIWPLIMLAFVRLGSRRIAGVARWLFLGAVGITIVTAVLSYQGVQQTPEFTPDAYWTLFGREISKPDALYLSTITRAGGLMLGSAFAMIWRPAAIMRGPLRSRPRIFDLAALVGFVYLALMAWYVSFKPGQGVHGFLFRGGFFFAGIATLAIIAAITHRRAFTGRVLSIPLLLWIGTRSYGLYLYHWPIYQVIRNVAAKDLAFHEFVLAMVATCIVTELSYRYVETPIRRGAISSWWRHRNEPRRRRAHEDGQRGPLVAGGVIGAMLVVFAGASLATAELQQNDVAESLAAGAEQRCDLVTGENCDDPATDPAAVPTTVGATAEPTTVPVGADATTDPAGTGEADGATPADAAATPTTEPVPDTTTTEVPAPASQRFAVGDSIMLGAIAQLEGIGFQVDAVEGRAFINGIDLVETLGSQGRLPELLLIHLGTNSAIQQGQMDRMVAAVADVPRVIMLTNNIDLPQNDSNNGLVYDAAATNANIEVLDWQGLSTTCPGDCFYADGYHLTPEGRTYYADVIQYVIDNG